MVRALLGWNSNLAATLSKHSAMLDAVCLARWSGKWTPCPRHLLVKWHIMSRWASVATLGHTSVVRALLLLSAFIAVLECLLIFPVHQLSQNGSLREECNQGEGRWSLHRGHYLPTIDSGLVLVASMFRTLSVKTAALWVCFIPHHGPIKPLMVSCFFLKRERQ